MADNSQVDLKALRGKIVEVYGTIEKFSTAFGISSTQMQNKLSGKSGWTLTDVQKAATLLGIRDNAVECHRIFF